VNRFLKGNFSGICDSNPERFLKGKQGLLSVFHLCTAHRQFQCERSWDNGKAVVGRIRQVDYFLNIVFE
jgi:hypothetical protein